VIRGTSAASTGASASAAARSAR